MITMVLAVALGALTWSFLEYVIHRWLGHDRRYRKNPFGHEHVRHHVEGDYFAPWYKKMIAALGAIAITSGPAILVAGFEHGLCWVGGLVGFYLFYEVQHRLLHVWAGVGPYARWARRHHFYHHFVDGRRNHGVTSPLWDHVFGTHVRAGVIAVPDRLVMRWLRDPETGGIRPEHADRYTVKKKPEPLRAAA